MKILGYVWRVIINIITVIVVLSVFSVAYTEFETAVFAILVLIYLSITSFSSIYALREIENKEILNNHFRDIKQLLDKNLVDEIDEIEKESKIEWEKKKSTMLVKFYINIFFEFIVYIIALYNLLSIL